MSVTGRPPNIILLLTDHFRPDAVGPSTPRLVEMAHRGASFAHAYTASPLCQPARASIISGLYPSQHGLCGNMAAPFGPEQRAGTFMRRLQEAGYRTAMVGRHHYIDGYGVEMDFTKLNGEVAEYGFDDVFQVLNPCEHLYNECEFTYYLRERGVYEQYRDALKHTGDGFPFAEDLYEDAFIGRKACEYVRACDPERPFYLNVGFSGPHPPYWHPGQTHDAAQMRPPVGAPDSDSVRRRRADYMDKCTLIDKYVGEIFDALGERGLLDNTVLVFTSDHGDNLGDYGIWDKRFFYEQSVGVPLILCGPGVPRGARDLTGKLSKQLASHLDLYPTIVRLAGCGRGSLAGRPGLDLLAMLREERGASREEVFSELATCAMIRTAQWKMVFDPEQGGVVQLFHLGVDPREERNLAAAPGYEGVVGDLVQRLLSHRIRLTQYTHDKEEQRLQHVRTPRVE